MKISFHPPCCLLAVVAFYIPQNSLFGLRLYLNILHFICSDCSRPAWCDILPMWPPTPNEFPTPALINTMPTEVAENAAMEVLSAAREHFLWRDNGYLSVPIHSLLIRCSAPWRSVQCDRNNLNASLHLPKTGTA